MASSVRSIRRIPSAKITVPNPMSRWLEVAQKHFDGSQPVRQNNRRGQDHKHIRFASHSLEHFFHHDDEDSCDGSNQFKDGSPYPFG